MSPSPIRPVLDRFVRRLAALLVGIFYRRLEVVGLERVPQDGPVLFVANHPNSLMDPFLLVGALPRTPRFLAKSTLWHNPLLRPLLALGGAVPVYRRQDVGADTSANGATFARCHAELAGGGAIALFPEGVSVHEPELQPIRTGAARIALETEAQHGDLGLRIVPLGLEFEDKGRFRSRALLVVGDPIDPSAERVAYGRDERAAVRGLTERIEAGLRAVTLNHRSFREADLVKRIASVYAEDERELPGHAPLAGTLGLRQRFAAAWERLAEQHPGRARKVADLVTRYDALLTRNRLRDDQITARYSTHEVALYLFDHLPLLAIWLPAALLGALLNALPAAAARGVGLATRRWPTLPATYKLLTGFVAFPVVWALEAALVGGLFGGVAGAMLFLAAPLTGFALVRFSEEHDQLRDEALAFLRLREKRSELRACRRDLRDEIQALAAVGWLPPGPRH